MDNWLSRSRNALASLVDGSNTPVTHRGLMLPFVEYQDGTADLGVPDILYSLLPSNSRGIQRQALVGGGDESGPYTSERAAYESAGDVLNIASAPIMGGVTRAMMAKGAAPKAATTGEVFFSNPDQSATAPLLARALEAEQPGGSINLFHGTDVDGLSKFSSDYLGAGTGQGYFVQGMHHTTNPDVAAEYGKHLYQSELPQDPRAILDYTGTVSNSPVADVLASFGIRDTPSRIDPSRPGTIGDAWSAARKAHNFDARDAFDSEVNAALRNAGVKAARVSNDHYVVLDDNALSNIRQIYSNPDQSASIPLLARALEQEGALPMDQASRLARAAEQGYDTSTVFYRGMPDANRLTPEGGFIPGDWSGKGKAEVFATSDPQYASWYAQGFHPKEFEQAPGVFPIYVKRGEGTRITDHGDGTFTAAVSDPSNYRSVNAAFDPAKAGQNGLLFSNPDQSASLPLMARALEAEQPGFTALPMDQASRLARAAEQGYDTGQVWYHGTDKDFGAFEPSVYGTTGRPWSNQGVYFSASPQIADEYAKAPAQLRDTSEYLKAVKDVDARNAAKWFWQTKENYPQFQWSDPEGAAIYPTHVKPGKQAVIDATNNNTEINTAMINQYKDAGYDSVLLRNNPDAEPIGMNGDVPIYADELVMFNPASIRSVNAAFDPGKDGQNGLLYALASMYGGASLSNLIDPQSANAADYGNRADGTPKGTGFLGELKRPDGSVSTELSVGVDINGKETEIPLLVPGLDQNEINWLLTHDFKPNEVPQSIFDKAYENALSRMRQGLSPFAD